MGVPALREAYHGWTNLTSVQHKRIEDAASVMGDNDSALLNTSTADEANAGEDDNIRHTTTMNIEEPLRSCANVHALETQSYSQESLNAWRHAAKSDMPESEGRRKTSLLLSAELFPPHALMHAPDTFRVYSGEGDNW